MLQGRPERLAGRAVPHARGIVFACGDDALAVGAERGGTYLGLMTQRRAKRLAGGAVSQARGLVEACRDEADAYRRARYCRR